MMNHSSSGAMAARDTPNVEAPGSSPGCCLQSTRLFCASHLLANENSWHI